MKVKFNRNPVVIRQNTAEAPPQSEVKTTPGLYNASLDDAVKFGGVVTQHALRQVKLRGDRRYAVVDVKVHMLMPGFMPAIPGWHTDGAPRNVEFGPVGPMPPQLGLQEVLKAPRYHLVIYGEGCNTRFLTNPLDLELPDEPTTDLYKIVTRQVNELKPESVEVPCGAVAEWDWWNLHTAVVATRKEWRFLMRVTESDYLPPENDLRQVIRTQHQVYIPQEFGW